MIATFRMSSRRIIGMESAEEGAGLEGWAYGERCRGIQPVNKS